VRLSLRIETTTDVAKRAAVRDFATAPALLVTCFLEVRHDRRETSARFRELFQHSIVNAEAFVTSTRVQSRVNTHSELAVLGVTSAFNWDPLLVPVAVLLTACLFATAGNQSLAPARLAVHLHVSILVVP